MVEPLKSRLLTLLENSNVHEITYKMLKSTDLSTLTKGTTCNKTFIDQLTENFIKLKTYSFISKKQPSYFQHLRDTLRKDEFLICLDFSENYAQSFHSNNNQSSLGTAVVYYRSSDDSIQHKSMGILSDNLAHDTTAVYCIQNLIIDYLNSKFQTINKLFYFTDGAGQHFINKSSIGN